MDEIQDLNDPDLDPTDREVVLDSLRIIYIRWSIENSLNINKNYQYPQQKQYKNTLQTPQYTLVAWRRYIFMV
jgi:hypothetical protein